MAINPNTQYPGQVEAPDAAYTYGGAKNERYVKLKNNREGYVRSFAELRI